MNEIILKIRRDGKEYEVGKNMVKRIIPTQSSPGKPLGFIIVMEDI